MDYMRVKQTALINAPRERVYHIIADYEVGHAAILPKPYFKSMDILKGGFGAGTEIAIELEVFGQPFSYHQLVTEPVPGYLIVERDVNTHLASSFYLESRNNDTMTHVTIDSQVALSSGVQRIMERLLNPMIIGGIFKQELRNLQAYVAANPVRQPST